MIQKVCALAAWLLLAAVAVWTISPLDLRPHVAGANLERLVAFATVGFLFAAGYSRHALRVIVMLSIAAAGLEFLQTLTPDRHGEVEDAVVKIAGAVAGVGVASVMTAMFGGRDEADVKS